VKAPFSTAVAIGVGILVLLGYFVPGIFGDVRNILVFWAVGVAAFALLVGVVNLLSVHWRKIQSNKPEAVYSVILIISFILTLAVVGWDSPTGPWSMWIFNNFQIPAESSLMAILAVVLALASARLLRRRTDSFSVIFLVTALVVLLGTAPIYLIGVIPGLSSIRNFIAQVLSVAGARGILLGVALGSIATGLRILMGTDRPYGG
jgi:hypothetical protein